MGIRGYPFCLWSNHLQITGSPSCRPVGSQFPVFLWVSGVSSFACGQITCKSQGLLPVGSQFLGFSWVSGDVRFACGQTTCKSQGILSVGSIPCVFVGVRGYPSFRSHKRKKMFLWLVEQTSCLITLALRIKRYISNNQIASKLPIYNQSQSFRIMYVIPHLFEKKLFIN